MADVVDMLLNLPHGPNFFEAYEVRTLTCCRRRKENDDTQWVTIEIWDAGPASAPDLRYRCRAVSEDGCRAAGKRAGTIEHALASVPWYSLDRPEARNV